MLNGVQLRRFSVEISNIGTVLTKLLGCISSPDTPGSGTVGSHHPVFAGRCATAVTPSGIWPRRAWHLGVLQRATLLLHALRGQLPEPQGGRVPWVREGGATWFQGVGEPGEGWRC